MAVSARKFTNKIELRRTRWNVLIAISAVAVSLVGSRGIADTCADGFSSFVFAARAKIVADMKSAAASAKMSTVKVRENEGRVVVDIGYIQNDDREIVRLLPVGVAEDAWDEVACGSIVGPKFTSYLARIASAAKSGSKVKFTGKLNPKDLFESQAEELEMGIRTPRTSSGSREPFYWGREEIREFRSSFEQLRVVEACRMHYGSERLETCGPLVFEITPGTDQFIFRKP